MFLARHARTLLLAQRHGEEQLLGPALVPVVGSLLLSSTAVACWVTNREKVLRHGIDLLNQRELLSTLLTPDRNPMACSAVTALISKNI